jgi:hypothetical protein
MRTPTRNISKVKQSRPKSSKPTLSQLTCTATDLCRLGEARSLHRIRETSAERQGDAFATFRFRYRSRTEFSYECSEVQYLLVQRICKLSTSSREVQALSHWKIAQRRHLLERSFSKPFVSRRYIHTLGEKERKDTILTRIGSPRRAYCNQERAQERTRRR